MATICVRVTAATPQRDAFERRAEEFSTEASKLEETMKTRLKEQKEWNKALVERRIVSHHHATLSPGTTTKPCCFGSMVLLFRGVGKSHAPGLILRVAFVDCTYTPRADVPTTDSSRSCTGPGLRVC